MADTAHKSAEAMKEHEETPEKLQKKAVKLAALIKASKHFIAFTGAGISTSTGIPDFRGPEGVWTLKAEGRLRTAKSVDVLAAIPSYTHRALVKLEKLGILKHTISQNVDGLHRRSGMDPLKLSELHGNSNLSRCNKCGKEILFDQRVRRAYLSTQHGTGIQCPVPKCDGELQDTIVNFGENLPEGPLENSWTHSRKADLCLVLGSSLTVSPACSMPKLVAKTDHDLVIVNMQNTPLDHLASLRVHGKCDAFMQLVMKELGINDEEIPPFYLRRRLVVTTTRQASQKQAITDLGGYVSQISLQGVDIEGTPVSFLLGSEIVETSGEKQLAHFETAPDVLQTAPFLLENVKCDPSQTTLRLYFRGHYKEPRLAIPLTMLAPPTGQSPSNQNRVTLDLRYNPLSGRWKVKAQKPQQS